MVVDVFDMHMPARPRLPVSVKDIASYSQCKNKIPKTYDTSEE